MYLEDLRGKITSLCWWRLGCGGSPVLSSASRDSPSGSKVRLHFHGAMPTRLEAHFRLLCSWCGPLPTPASSRPVLEHRECGSRAPCLTRLCHEPRRERQWVISSVLAAGALGLLWEGGTSQAGSSPTHCHLLRPEVHTRGG